MKAPADESLTRLATRYIRRQIRQLTGQIEGIRRAADTEPIHQARVAMRRLRTALAVFADCLGAERTKAWRKALKRAANELGDARDEDVQIEFLCGAIARVRRAEAVPGLARVLGRCEKKRRIVQPQVIRSLKDLLAGRTLHQILATCKSLSPKSSSVPLAGPAVFAHAAASVVQRFEEMWALRGCLADPSQQKQHHALRIAAKRLRYTLEIYRAAYGGRLDPVIDVTKQLQSYLGDIHDCDVWVENLHRFTTKEGKRIAARYGRQEPLARLKVGIDYLEADCLARRRELFDSLVRYWQGLTAECFWDEMLATVRDGL